MHRFATAPRIGNVCDGEGPRVKAPPTVLEEKNRERASRWAPAGISELMHRRLRLEFWADARAPGRKQAVCTVRF